MNFSLKPGFMKAVKYLAFTVLICLPAILSAQTLIGSWQFNGNANDISGNNLNGTVYNATLTAGKDGIPNTAYLFNGYSSHIDVPYSALLDLTTWTIQTTVRVDGFNSSPCQQENIVGRGTEYSGDNMGAALNDNVHDNSCGTYSPNNTEFLGGAAGTPVANWMDVNYIQLHTWYSVTFTYDGIYGRVYINGSIADSIAWSNQYSYGNTQPILSFGYLPSGGISFPYWFNGAIDNVSIWQGALSSTTINNNYNNIDTISINQPFVDTVICLPTGLGISEIDYSVNVSGVFQPGNVFTAQLSDSTGSFVNSTAIGSVTSVTSGFIHYSIPASTPTGDKYRIRVVSSNPQIISDDDGINIYISHPGSVSVSISTNTGDTICMGTPVTFTANSVSTAIGGSFIWRKNNVVVETILNTYSGYSIYVDGGLNNGDTITCEFNTSFGCVAADAVARTIMTVNPASTATATITANIDTVICAGTPVTFNASMTNGGASPGYQWQINGILIPGASTVSYTDISLLPGDVITCIGISSLPCTAPATSQPIALTINPAPDTAVANSGSIHVCAGDSIVLNAAVGTSYQWQKNGVNIAGATSGTYVVHSTGNYTVFVTNNYGCSITSSTVPATISAVPPAPIANIGGYLQICTGDSLLLGTTSYIQGYTYQWYWNGNIINGVSGSTYTAYTAGTYKVTVADYGCSNTSADLAVTTIPSPTDTLLSYGGTVMCPGGTAISLSGGTSGSPESYLWFVNGQPIASATNATYTAPTIGTYRLRITDTDNGCSSFSKPVVITPGFDPVPVITYQWPKFKTETFSSYQWYYNGSPIMGAISATYAPTQSGVYTVLVKDVNGCSGASANYYFAYSGVSNVSVSGSDIKIYPNPANDIVYIDAPVTVNATLYTIDGRLVQSGKSIKQMDVSGLTSGVYMIVITDENNVTIKTDKLVKGL